jgi:hypothetical protein
LLIMVYRGLAYTSAAQSILSRNNAIVMYTHMRTLRYALFNEEPMIGYERELRSELDDEELNQLRISGVRLFIFGIFTTVIWLAAVWKFGSFVSICTKADVRR